MLGSKFPIYFELQMHCNGLRNGKDGMIRICCISYADHLMKTTRFLGIRLHQISVVAGLLRVSHCSLLLQSSIGIMTCFHQGTTKKPNGYGLMKVLIHTSISSFPKSQINGVLVVVLHWSSIQSSLFCTAV